MASQSDIVEAAKRLSVLLDHIASEGLLAYDALLTQMPAGPDKARLERQRFEFRRLIARAEEVRSIITQ